MKKMINIMFCGNDKVFDGMIITLLSIVKHCKKELNIYVLTMNLQELNKQYRPLTNNQIIILEKIIKNANNKSKISLIDVTETFKKEMLSSVNIKNALYAIYFFKTFFR